MATSPDSVTYTQTIAELVAPEVAPDWSNVARPDQPQAGMFGIARETSLMEFYDGTTWRNPIWTSGGTFTGPVNLTAGGSFAGTFSGNHTYSGALTLSSAGTALAVTNNATIGGTLGVTGIATVGVSGGNQITITGGATSGSPATIGRTGTGTLNLTNNITISTTGLLSAPFFSAANAATINWTGSTGPVAGLPAVRAVYSVSGTPTSGLVAYDYTAVNADTLDGTAITGTPPTVSMIQHNFGGAAMIGGRAGFEYNGTLTTKSGNAAAGLVRDFVGGNFWLQSAVNEGGTGFDAGQFFGALYPGNFKAVLSGAATYWREINPIEIDLAVKVGSSVLNKLGMQIVLLSGDVVHAAEQNSEGAISIANQYVQGAGAGWYNGINFGKWRGAFPMDPVNGALINVIRGNGDTVDITARVGIDTRMVAFSDATLLSRNISISDGAAQIGALVVSASSSTASVDASGSVGVVSGTSLSGGSIVSGGSGGAVQYEQLNDAYRGTWVVSGVSGGVITAVKAVAPSMAASGSPSATLTLTPTIGSAITGTVSVTQTWTRVSALALNASGGATTIGGTLAVTGATTSASYKVSSSQVVGARITGWGAGTNGAKTAFNGATATLAQTSAAVAQLIADLTTHGLIGT